MAKAIKKKPVTKKVIKKQVAKKSKISPLLKTLGIANVVAFLAVIVVNYLATSLPIGGMTTGALADLYPNLFIPAGLTFSIWGLIYFLVLGFVVRQLIDLFRKKTLWITKKTGIWFLLSCAANVGRIFAWHHQQVFLSMLILIFFLVVMMVIVTKMNVGKKLWTRKEKLFVQTTFSVYLGWLSVAVIANITSRLVHVGWSMRGMTDVFRTMIAVGLATLLALLAICKKNNIVFALVIIWAFVGIVIKRLEIDPVYAKSIIRMLGICISVISLGIGLRFKERKNN